MFTHAITRVPGANFASGLTTHTDPEKPDYNRILQQHAAYVAALQDMGLEVIIMDPLVDHPDAYFVEDAAVVTPHIAVITNPGADSRKGETDSIGRMLSQFHDVRYIRAPGTVDGGDVLMVGTHFFIGISERTNQEGARQLGAILKEFGYTWVTVAVGAGLHFKSSVNYIGENTLLVTNDFAEHELLKGYDKIIVDPDENYAANTLFVNDHLIMPAGYPKTRRKLAKLKSSILELDVSEVRKMDGGLTCMSLRL